MQVSSGVILAANEAAGASSVIGVVFDHGRPTQNVNHIVELDVVFHHLLMGVRRYAKLPRICLLAKAFRDCFEVVRAGVRHILRPCACS